ncbi:MAG: DUF302 domain-containing protein [Metallosphaera sp.]|uniref:DUF302 domain-containing protein n=1 Tax=Metallosphaera sp. TaxID=2020860 RepID=UPI003167B066
MIVKEFSSSMDELESEIKKRIIDLGAEIFAEIDHAENAKKVGMRLDPTKVIIFGNPKVGTLLMQERREIAYELPLRIVIWTSSGKTYVGYKRPSELASEFEMRNLEVLKRMDEFMEKITNLN